MSSVRNSSGRDHIFRVGRDLANRSQGRSSVRHLLPGRRIRASRRRGIGQSDPHLFPNNSLIDCSPLLKQAPPDVLNRGNSGQILPADCRRFPTFFPVIREFGWQDGGQNQEPASDPARHRAEPDYTLPCLPQPGARSSNFLRFLINLQISENFQQREVPPHVNRCSSVANRCAAVVYLLWIKCSAEAMKSSNTFCLCARERKRQWERELPRTARMQLTCFRRRA